MNINVCVRFAVLFVCLHMGCGMRSYAQTVSDVALSDTVAHGHASVSEAKKAERKLTNRMKDSLTIAEVVVSSRRKTVSANSVSATMNHEDIVRAMGKSLASMLENTSGLSSIQTGTTVSKPVIHGMYGNRILIMANGARLTGQQWGPDHAPEVDKNGFDRVSVVKGSESVRYGSDALGGIVLMERSRLPYGRDCVHGALTALYGSNGRRYGVVGRAEGTMPWCHDWAWRAQATFENGGDRSTASYLLNNTGTRERDLSVSMGYCRGPWRLEAGYALFWQKIGVMRSAQMGSEELLRERIRLGRPVCVAPFSYAIDYPHQKVAHQTAFAKVYYDGGAMGQLDWQATFQADDRRENRIRRMNHSDIPTVSLHLKSLQNLLTWQRGYRAWKSEAGLQLLNTKNSNERGTGVVPIIPNYAEVAFGAYGVQKYTAEKWGVEAGARFDCQRTEADGYDWTGRRYGGKRHFDNLTFSVGGHCRPATTLTFTSNVGLAWRAPHVYELYSNGNELGSGMFVKGDSTLQSERSLKWVTSAEYATRHLNMRVDGYLQWVSHYIYDEPTRENIVVVSGAYPVFQYKQTGAFIRGVDVDVHIRPWDEVDYRVFTALIWANESQTGNYLPYIPSARLTQQMTYTPRVGDNLRLRLGINHRFVAKQTRFNPDADLVDFTPDAYHLLGFEIGAEWKSEGGQMVELALMGDNVLNKEYKEYTNRSRYYAHDMGRDIRCTLTWKF